MFDTTSFDCEMKLVGCPNLKPSPISYVYFNISKTNYACLFFNIINSILRQF